MLDPATALSEEPNESAFARSHNAMACFDWLDLPENTNELKKFGIAMAVSHTHGERDLMVGMMCGVFLKYRRRQGQAPGASGVAGTTRIRRQAGCLILAHHQHNLRGFP